MNFKMNLVILGIILSMLLPQSLLAQPAAKQAASIIQVDENQNSSTDNTNPINGVMDSTDL